MTAHFSIKEHLKLRQVVEYYGFKMNRAGFINCPIHGEKTASLKIYNNDKGFYCFGCGEGGDVITFTMKVFSIDFKTAITKLKNDFGIEDNKGVDYKKIKKQKNILEAKEKIRKRKEHLEDIEFRTLWLKHLKLRKLPPHEEFWENLDNLLKLEDFKYNGL